MKEIMNVQDKLIDPLLPIPIITLNWNGIADTLECAKSVLSMNTKKYIWYLVDNGSKAKEREILQSKFHNQPNIKLVFNKQNLGFTLGNNQIIKNILSQESLPKYIILLNNDVVVDQNWLQAIVESANRNDAGMVSSKILNYYDHNSIDNVGHFILNTGEILPIGHGRPATEYTEIIENIGACGAAALYSTEMLLDIGIFDEYFDTGYEDAELGLRANIMGYKTIFEPNAIIYHKKSQSINKIKDINYLVKLQSNIIYTNIKLLPFVSLMINLPFILFKYFVVLLFELMRFRIEYAKSLYRSIKEDIIPNFNDLIAKRRQFATQHKRRISCLTFFKKQSFFLKHSLNRVDEILLHKSPTQFN